VCFGGSTGLARERTRFSLVALRRRLSPVLPLSPTSKEGCDPAVLMKVQFIKSPTTVGELLFLLMGDDHS
jgi:hypothetical protein